MSARPPLGTPETRKDRVLLAGMSEPIHLRLASNCYSLRRPSNLLLESLYELSDRVGLRLIHSRDAFVVRGF
jgi:hypothetical protein